MPPTSILATIIILAILLLTILTSATCYLLARRRAQLHGSADAEDTIRLTLNGPRSTEQVEYMKQVRERNLMIAWGEAMRFQNSTRKTAMAVGSASASASAIEENETYFDGDDEETDLGTASVNAGAMVLGSRSQQYLAPPIPPWMKRSPTMGSSVYSSDSAKSKSPTAVEEWESEHGGFSAYFGMKQPITQERWV